jgi:phospholipase C
MTRAATARFACVAFAMLAPGACVSSGPSAGFEPSSGGIVRTGAFGKSPIKHVVLVIQENRTFNDFFAGFPGADGSKVGKIAKSRSCHVSADTTIALRKSDLSLSHDLNHTYKSRYQSQKDSALLGAGTGIRPRRAHVYNARQQQFYGASRSDRRRDGRRPRRGARRRSRVRRSAVHLGL